MPAAPPNPESLCKNHFALFLNSLNSFGAEPDPAHSLFSDLDDECIVDSSKRRLGFSFPPGVKWHSGAGPRLQTQLAARGARHPRQNLFLRPRRGHRSGEAHATGAAQSPAGISPGNGSVVVAD